VAASLASMAYHAAAMTPHSTHATMLHTGTTTTTDAMGGAAGGVRRGTTTRGRRDKATDGHSGVRRGRQCGGSVIRCSADTDTHAV
jgi:hypothetical protein